MSTHPDAVELFGGVFYEVFVIAEDTGFEAGIAGWVGAGAEFIVDGEITSLRKSNRAYFIRSGTRDLVSSSQTRSQLCG